MLVLRFMKRHMNMLKIMVNGARTETRRIIWKAFCRLLTSVVMRVMSPDVENLSMFPNENFWTLLNMSALRFAAKPAEALAENLPAKAPHARETKAARAMKPPDFRMSSIWAPASMLLTIGDVIKGINTSSITSPTMNTSARIVSVLY